jgi:hypothetical protein
MGLATSCGGDPGGYIHDALAYTDSQADAPAVQISPDASDNALATGPDAGLDAPVVDASAVSTDGAGQ